ncbi:T9SS C-terminal target domain-containing protein [Sphingobacteriales bacterium UPWRP_1]|nr:hypothetical protein B6N25_02445 [Sphingobacteriales bacterium TSM_CSS]PSJ75922.1 T9SS C-terminal target domain-containing protein [Sphingobacteriales bacterium UPWRP_1]
MKKRLFTNLVTPISLVGIGWHRLLLLGIILTLTGQSVFAQTFTAAGTPAAIPDPGNVSVSVTVTGLPGTVATADEVQINLNISHAWASDIVVGVTPPGGTEILIVNRIGGSSNNNNWNSANTVSIRSNASGPIPVTASNTNFDIPTGTYLPTGFTGFPVGNLASLVGATRNGNWTIRVRDDDVIITGTLQAASITFFGVSPPAPANDFCANAIPIVCGGTATGSTTTAGVDGPVEGCEGPPAPDVWYTIVGTGADITASLCGSGYNTTIDVYTGACGALTSIGCNDDFCGEGQSQMTWSSTFGTVYLIRVYGFNGSAGNYSLAVTCADPCPVATISYADTPFCSSVATGAVTQTGTTGGTYSSTAGLTINSSTGAITPSSSTPGTYTVTYTIAAAGSCAAVSTTASVTITALPVAAISYAGTPFCSSAATGAVTLTGDTGGTYSSTAGLTINSSTGAITPSSSTPGTYTVTYTIAAAGGCAAVSTTASVTITALPVAAISYTGTPFCSSAATGAVTLTGETGGTYSSTAGLTINSSTGAITPSSSTPGTYTVTYTIAAAGGCAAVTATASVTVNPVLAVAITGIFSPCNGTTLTMTAVSPGATSYAWSGPGGYMASGATISRPSATVAMSGVYTVVVTGANGCTASTSQNISIIAPTITITGPTSVCVGQTITLTATGGGSYSWSGPLGLKVKTATMNANATSTAWSGTYTVTVTGSNGCTGTASQLVTVNALPVAGITGNSTVCSGGTITLTATGGSTYSWSGPGSYTASGATIMRSPAAAIMSGSYIVTVTNTAGCSKTASRTVSVVTCKTGEEIAAVELSAYPNPTGGETMVTFTSNTAQNTLLSVYDVVGKEVAVLFKGITEENTVYELPLDMTLLSPGTYFAVLQTESGERQQIKLLVVH